MSQLLYVYIHKYRRIEEQGFNLSSKYSITFDYELLDQKQFENPRIDISIQENAIPHLFDASFKDIKAIIGENGAGKSTLLQYLAFACNGHPNYLEYPKQENRDIIIYKTENQFKEDEIYIALGSAWDAGKITITGPDAQKISIRSEDNLYWEELPFFKTPIVYYSNVFDNRLESEFSSGPRNISTNYLVRDDLEKFHNQIVPRLNNTSQLAAHAAKEDGRRISFGLKHRQHIPFPISEDLIMYFNRKSRAELDNLQLSKQHDREWSDESKLISAWLSKTSALDNATKSQGRGALHREFFDYFIWHQLLEKNDSVSQYFEAYPKYQKEIFQKINELFTLEQGIPDLHALIAFAKNSEKKINDNSKINLGDAELSRILTQFENFDSLMSTVYQMDDSFFGSGFKLGWQESTYRLQEQYRRTLLITEYLTFSLPGLSSGELGFFTLFSRFYSLVDPHNFGGSRLPEENILILIDEGDLYFHPQWQVRFLSFINDLLPQIFENKSIQLIITSHSPFIASDLPTNNLLFLKKGDKESLLPFSAQQGAGKTEQVSPPEYTFGANIHDLLANSFFLAGALIGQLAKEVIFKILDQLSGEQVEEPYKDSEMLGIINQIGESWVRSRLIEKYEEYQTKKTNT